jgi:transcriptional regulator with XRE-family HTH domain
VRKFAQKPVGMGTDRKMKSDSEIGNLIKKLRNAKEMTQGEFAEVLGASQSQISEWELGRVTPSSEIQVRLGNLAPYPDCLEFYSRAGVALGRIKGPGDAVDRMLEFMATVEPERARMVRQQIAGMNPDWQYDHVLRAFASAMGDIGAFKGAILKFLEAIRRTDPSHAQALEREMVGIPLSDQLERVTQALVNIMPGEARTDWKSGLSPEDKGLIERFEAALKKLESWGERPK